MIPWEVWEREREAYVASAPTVPQVYLNFHLLLTHSKVWADQLALIREDPETGLSYIRTDPIDIERVMERKVLALWNKLTPSNSATIIKQLEELPIALSEERFRNFLTKLIVTLQANRVFVPTYMKTLQRLEEHKAWQDESKKLGSIGRTLQPLLEELLASYLRPASLEDWLDKQGPFVYPEEQFESEQRWKRNFHAVASALMYGSAHGLWAPSVWMHWQERLLETVPGLEAWISLYQSREGPCHGRDTWQSARELAMRWKQTLPTGRLSFLLDNVLEDFASASNSVSQGPAPRASRAPVREGNVTAQNRPHGNGVPGRRDRKDRRDGPNQSHRERW